MSVNLLNLFKDQLSGAAMKGISSMLGESESNTGSAMTGIIASLMGSLAGKASTSAGASGLLSDLGKADTGILDNITDLIGGDSKNSLLETGGGLVSSLLGNKSNSVIDAISSMAGMSKGSSGTLMKLAAPMLMGFVGKYVKNKALDAVGLGSLLGSQKDHIKSAMPSGLFESLGFGSIGKATDAVKSAAGTVTSAAKGAANTVSEATPATGGGGFMKPLLIALALLALGFFGYRSCQGNHDGHHAGHTEHTDHEADAQEKIDAAADELNNDHAGHDHSAGDHDHGEDKGDDGDAGDDVAKMDSKGLNFSQGTWAWTLSDFLDNGTGTKSFALDKIPFEGDEISAEADEQLTNLAAILNAYPEVNAEVQGHTAKAKNAIGATAKKAASRVRAIWVQQKLKAKGVSGDKLSSAGYGDEQLLPNIAEDADAQKRIVIKFSK